MFLGRYELNGETQFGIYYKNKYGYKAWVEETLNPLVENVETLDLKITGETYEERKDCLEELAIDFQRRFQCWWSYGELYTIQGWFYENAKRYGLVKVFRENAIC